MTPTRKRRIRALLSRWETIRFANSEKDCAEDFAAMIVDLEDRLAATPAPLDVERLAHRAAEIGFTYGALGRDFEYVRKNVSDMLAAEEEMK